MNLCEEIELKMRGRQLCACFLVMPSVYFWYKWKQKPFACRLFEFSLIVVGVWFGYVKSENHMCC